MTVPVEDLRARSFGRPEPSGERWRRPRVAEARTETEGRADEGGASVDVHRSEDLGLRSPLHEALLRALNFSVAALVLTLGAPVFLLIAIAIRLDSPGPVFYRQLRVGVDRRRDREGDPASADGRRTGDLGGRPFVIHKFRTMQTNAEEDLGPTWSDDDDERVTRVGRFLREHRLDELPQFWNVLKGDMAVVGPRPERPTFFRELRRTFESYPRRQTVPPGITGWAQVNRESDRSVDDVQHKLRYDLQYLERRSLWFDLYIMLKTPVVMAKREMLAGRSSAASNGGPPWKEAT